MQGPAGPIGPPGPAGQPGDKVTTLLETKNNSCFNRPRTVVISFGLFSG